MNSWSSRNDIWGVTHYYIISKKSVINIELKRIATVNSLVAFVRFFCVLLIIMMNNQSAMSLTPCRKKNSLMADGEGGSGGGDNEHFVVIINKLCSIYRYIDYIEIEWKKEAARILI